eukprot:14053581-Alexandrium_andersonii.AAC.1
MRGAVAEACRRAPVRSRTGSTLRPSPSCRPGGRSTRPTALRSWWGENGGGKPAGAAARLDG